MSGITIPRVLVAVRVVGAVFPAPASAGEQEKGCALVRCGVFLSISLTERYIPRCFEIPMNLGVGTHVDCVLR